MNERTRTRFWVTCVPLLLGAAPAAVLAQESTPQPAPERAAQPHLTVGTEPGQRLAPPLDLRAPALTQVFSPAALQLMLVEQEEANGEAADVRVEGQRATPDVPRGMFRAIPWAVMHPTQSWRIFMPLAD